MARHYSIKNLFRQMPNALLARYFQTQGLFAELDFTGMQEGSPETRFATSQAPAVTPHNLLGMELRRILAVLVGVTAAAR